MHKCAENLVEPLRILFTVCLEAKSIPLAWKCADVVPIYKGTGLVSSPRNYRPISLTSPSSKVMETCVKNSILQHLVDNNILSSHQHGFLPKRSTLTEMLECINDWMDAIEKGEYIDVVYVDLRKAFDSVVHSKLLYKCEQYGI